MVLGGCAILLTINCPIYGTLLNWVNAVTAYVHARVVNFDGHLISDNINATPEVFNNVHPRLGGLYTIMSCSGSVGNP